MTFSNPINDPMFDEFHVTRGTHWSHLMYFATWIHLDATLKVNEYDDANEILPHRYVACPLGKPYELNAPAVLFWRDNPNWSNELRGATYRFAQAADLVYDIRDKWRPKVIKDRNMFGTNLNVEATRQMVLADLSKWIGKY